MSKCIIFITKSPKDCKTQNLFTALLPRKTAYVKRMCACTVATFYGYSAAACTALHAVDIISLGKRQPRIPL